jgi:hypothetical protein
MVRIRLKLAKNSKFLQNYIDTGHGWREDFRQSVSQAQQHPRMNAGRLYTTLWLTYSTYQLLQHSKSALSSTQCFCVFCTNLTASSDAHYVAFEVLTAVVMESSAFWDITPRLTFNGLQGVILISQKIKLFNMHYINWLNSVMETRCVLSEAETEFLNIT